MKVQVGGYKGRGAGGKAIKWFSNGGYSHVSLVFTHDDELREEIESIQFKGVHTQEFNPDGEECDLFDVLCSDEQAYRIYESARELIGCKYDWGGIWGLVRRRRRENMKKWFCSELVAHCLKEGGVILHNLPAWKQIPVITCASVRITKAKD